MKLLGFEDILDRAIEKYEVKTPDDWREEQKYRDTEHDISALFQNIGTVIRMAY